MYIIHYESAVTYGIIHEAYAADEKEAEALITALNNSGYKAWIV